MRQRQSSRSRDAAASVSVSASGPPQRLQLRDFFVSPNKAFLNWRKVYRTALILVMLHFLVDQHHARRSSSLTQPPPPSPPQQQHQQAYAAEEPPRVNTTPLEAQLPTHQEASTRADLDTELHVEHQYGVDPYATRLEGDGSVASVAVFVAFLADASFTLRAFLLDVFYLHYDALTWTSVKIACVGACVYALLRPLDARVHSFFYDVRYHRNMHQLPDTLNRVAKRGLKWYRNLCMLTALWPLAASPIAQDSALMFVQGSMWMSLVKRGLKMAADAKHLKGARRPPNEHFIRGIYYGGFPSGHMSHSAYAIVLTALTSSGALQDQTLLWGLALHSLLAIMWLVSSNRHYPSQVVAGLTLGTIYAFSAYHVILTPSHPHA